MLLSFFKSRLFLSLFLVLSYSQALFSHCQVPCGIYDDGRRFAEMLEDVKTIQKACVKMNELSKETTAEAQQQFVRWVQAKEDHAERIIRSVSDYFLAQRLKVNMKNYLVLLKEFHGVILGAVTAKQKTDVVVVEKLDFLIRHVQDVYNGVHSHNPSSHSHGASSHSH